MKYTLNRLARANEDKKTSILQSTLTEIENDSDLEAKVGELLPFLSDKDRNMRIQAITVLSFFNTQFKIPAVRKAIAEMAAIKLADSACLQASCEIISTNIDILDSEQLNDTFDKLISIDLRVNLYAARLSAYQLFDKIIKKGISITKPSIVEKFKVFCGYEQDPRCLKVVFNIFQKFTNLIIDKLDKAQISELFDVVSVFYPISQNTDLANQLSECLASNPKFADDLAELVSAKLKNSLADTRTPIYRSLSILLVHKTKPELVVSVVSSFIISLREHFEGGSTATDENTVNSAITSIVKFVELNPDSHQMLSSIAISEWISTEIIESENMNSIRAYSIVSWNIDKVIHFSKQVIAPLAAVVQKSFESHDENRVQSILASIVEFLKLQDFHDLTDDSFTPFLTIANNSLLSDNRNLHITSLVIIRELSNHLHLPFNPTLLTNLLMHIELEPFSTSALNSLSTQTEYENVLLNELLTPLIESISTHTSFHSLKSSTEVSRFASHLCTNSFFSRYIFNSFAKSKNYQILHRSLLPIKQLSDNLSDDLLEILSTEENVNDDLILTISLRTNGNILSKNLLKHNSLFDLILTSILPKDIPTEIINEITTLNESSRNILSCKLSSNIIEKNPFSLALEGIITSDFDPVQLIPELLIFEDQFDESLGEIYNKFDVINQRFIYNEKYKEILWNKFHLSLNDSPYSLIKLCLLCPPEMFLSDIAQLIKMFPKFIDVDLKGALDLILFCIIRMDNNIMKVFVKVFDEIIEKLLEYYLLNENVVARTRIDIVRVLRLIPLSIDEKECMKHKTKVIRKLRMALDDDKREIRKEAADAKLAWMKLTEE